MFIGKWRLIHFYSRLSYCLVCIFLLFVLFDLYHSLVDLIHWFIKLNVIITKVTIKHSVYIFLKLQGYISKAEGPNTLIHNLAKENQMISKLYLSTNLWILYINVMSTIYPNQPHKYSRLIFHTESYTVSIYNKPWLKGALFV